MRIFVGTADVCRVEQKMMIDSVRRYASVPVEVVLLNGDTGRVEGEHLATTITVPDTLRRQFVTRFTAMRFEIPALCGYNGIAVYMDSDQLVRADVAELVHALTSGSAFAAVRADQAICGSEAFRRDVLETISTPARRNEYFLASVLVMDTARCRFDLRQLAAAMEAGLSYWDMIWFGPQFRARFGLTGAALDPRWNELDEVTPDAKLVHFTAINTQPWAYSHYTPTGRFWLHHFEDALERGVLDAVDLRQQYRHGKLSWSNLQRGLAILGHRSAPEPLLDAFDIGKWALLASYWASKRVVRAMTRRSDAVGSRDSDD
jgi:hypothetical protein